MDNKHIYDDKRRFVDGLNEPLSVLTDFEAVEYAMNPITCDEYIRIRDKLGSVWFVNVTGNSKEAILKELSRVCLGERAVGLVTNTEAKRYIAPMVRRAV